ncbi:MAG: carboxynorspermidine decarboxylase [Evtepia sp.]
MVNQPFRTPYFLVDEARLTHNLELLKEVAQKSGCKILLAQKAFSMFSAYPLLRRYLDGTTASGLYEAILGHETFGGETHVYSPAYRPDEFEAILSHADHIVFNSPTQLEKYGLRARNAHKSIGLRINPECSTQDGHAIYDPCAPASRLGTTKENFQLPIPVDGLHFHTLCEQNADALELTLAAVESKFDLHGLRWLNLGGGHHITRSDYDRDKLIEIIKRLRETYGVTVYLEPGEAVVLNAGFLVSSVLEVVHNGLDIAILDTSAACHMPDVLEMPYRPSVIDGGEAKEKKYTYRLAGGTCLAGDVIGDYSFDAPLTAESTVVFEDMALYTMVKTNTFNGMALPSIVWRDLKGNDSLIRSFGYEAFKERLS